VSFSLSFPLEGCFYGASFGVRESCRYLLRQFLPFFISRGKDVLASLVFFFFSPLFIAGTTRTLSFLFFPPPTETFSAPPDIEAEYTFSELPSHKRNREPPSFFLPEDLRSLPLSFSPRASGRISTFLFFPLFHVNADIA